ncbi:cytochrome P450 [Xylariales sp. AK1849]|nr:cytochrome P450 [Xylariales sp. AK1849]
MTLASLAVNLALLTLFAVICTTVAFFVKRVQQDAKFHRLGNVRATCLARDPITAAWWYRRMSRYQAENKLLDWYNFLYSHASSKAPNIIEIEVFPGCRFLVTREPEHVKTLLTGKFADFGKGPTFHQLWKPFLGDSIFTTDGKLWHDSRALIRPMFIKDRVSDLDIFERHSRALMGLLPPSGENVELMDLLYRMTLDITTEFLLGTSVGSLENTENNFAEAFDEVQRLQMRILMTHPFDVFMGRGDYLRHVKTVEEYIVPFIQETLALPYDEQEKLADSDNNSTFLHHLANFTRDPKVIRDQILAVLLAGRDTTAATLAWAFYELAVYPEKWARLRAEVLSAVGQEAPTYEDLKGMRYLRYTLQETLRLYPAVPYNIRTALVDTTLPGAPGQPDIAVLAGDMVRYQPMSIQRRSDLYPQTSESFADPSLFSPERWYTWQPRPWEYIPFNGGPRICVGQNFAMTEMAYFMVRILQKYERLEYRGDWDAQLHKADLIGRPKFGVPVVLYEAEE